MSNSMFSQSQRQILDNLKLAYEIGSTIMIYGPAGCSKSQQAMAMAREMVDKALQNPRDEEHKNYLLSLKGDKDNGEPINFVDVRLATEAPESIKGVIIPQENSDGSLTSTTAYNGRYPSHPDWVGVILFDEVTNAPPSLQQIAYQAFNDRKIENLIFPKGALIMGAGNRRQDGGQFFELLKPVANRVIQIEIEPVANHWVEDYAIEAEVHPSVLTLVSSKPALIYTGDKETEDTAFASMRSWEKLSKLVYKLEEGNYPKDLIRSQMAGTIGEYAYTEWDLHYKIGHKLPSIQDIIDGKNPAFNPDDNFGSSSYYYVAYGCYIEYSKRLNDLKISDEQIFNDVATIFEYFGEHFGDDFEIVASMALQFHKKAKDKLSERGDWYKKLLSSDANNAFKKAISKKIAIDQEIEAYQAA